MPCTSQNNELQPILAAQIMALMVERWLIGLVKGSESESELDSDSDLTFSSNLSMENFFSVNGSLEFSSDNSMKDLSDNDSIDNFSGSHLIDSSSSNDSLDNSSSNNSLKEEVQGILLETMHQLDTMQYVNFCWQIVKTLALIEN